ncbi:TonB-dependent receptor [Niveispirillum sp.]|uniref:TonB-dependent receptor n=1 Tax=Niveispirillum sp. TaxID=1917217 RepID=UPI001B70B7F4|nr:TonB-dependent receptor [Niveispirillum sp.]MBP7337810.1 TonB-dependent receptor [Niveispirillum sp.]
MKACLRSASTLALLLGLAATGSAAAQEAVTLEEIVVTAQKRAQNLQEVPVAVSAVSADTLQSRGITETSDLMGAMPSLQVTTPYGRTQPNFSLRGISVANEFSASTASPVGVYVDEVYQSFRASHGQQLYDLDRVEVLRGPQGTLYGRNTTGGAVSFFTKRPSLQGDEGHLTLGYGNYDTKTAEGAVEATLAPDKLGIRLAGTIAKGDGWLYNPVQKRDIGTTNSAAGRATLRWQPSDALDVTVKLFAARDNPVAATPYAQGQLGGGKDALGYSRFDPQPLLGGRKLGENEVAADQGGNYFSSSRGGSLTVNYDISDALSLTSITGYDTGKYRNAPFDCDGSPNDLCSIRYYSSSKNFNQDMRLTYEGDRLHVIGGAYYGQDQVYTHNQPDFFGVLRPLLLGAGLPGSYGNPAVATPDSIGIVPAFAVNPSLKPGDAGFCAPVTINPKGFLDARSLLALLADIAANNDSGGGFGGAISAACRTAGAPPFAPILGDQYFTVKRPSKAIYGDVSIDLTDDLKLAVGLRYTWDKVKYLNGHTALLDLAGKNIIASTIPYSYPYNGSLPAVNQTEGANRLTGRANLSYDFTDEVMGYVNYSRGYRSGSFNGLAYQGLNQVYYIHPEKVDAYETGLKTRLFDRRVQLNLSGFYYDYANHQVTQIIGATAFTRSANGRLYGGEAELTVQAADDLRLDATLGLLNTKYKGNRIDPTNPASPTINVNGNPFPNAPKTTFSGGFDWDVASFGPGDLKLRGDTSYMGKYYFDPFKDYGQSPCDKPAPGSNVLQAGPAIACGNPSYWLFNARLTYDTPDWSVALWGKNLTNKYYYNYGLNISIFGLDYLNRGMPRTYGVEFTARF